jgi:hypothetical protein
VFIIFILLFLFEEALYATLLGDTVLIQARSNSIGYVKLGRRIRAISLRVQLVQDAPSLLALIIAAP